MALILYLQLFCTLFMTGLIWFVQVVHYPLFDPAAASESGVAFHREHVRRTSWVVCPVMVVELITAMMLVRLHASSSAILISWILLGLLIAIWVSTAILQVPAHDQLGHGWDAGIHHRLVTTNWIRTVCWSARSILLLSFFTRSSL